MRPHATSVWGRKLLLYVKVCILPNVAHLQPVCQQYTDQQLEISTPRRQLEIFTSTRTAAREEEEEARLPVCHRHQRRYVDLAR